MELRYDRFSLYGSEIWPIRAQGIPTNLVFEHPRIRSIGRICRANPVNNSGVLRKYCVLGYNLQK